MARDLPDGAMRSDLWSADLSPTPAARRGLSVIRGVGSGRRASQAYAIWEATGIVGACLLLAGRPGPLVVRLIDQVGAEPREGGPGPARRVMARALGRREVRGLRWARAAGFDILAPTAHQPRAAAVGAGETHGVDLCLVRLAPRSRRTPSTDALHTLLCDASRGMRPGGLVMTHLRLAGGGSPGFGGADLRGLVAGLDEAGLTMIGDLDGRAGLFGAVRAALEDPASRSDRADGARARSDARRVAAGATAPEPEASPEPERYAVVRLMLRYRGASGDLSE